MPGILLYRLLLFAVVVFLVALIHIGAITIAFDKLGLSPGTGLLLLVGSLIGSGINIPVDRRKSRAELFYARFPVKPGSRGGRVTVSREKHSLRSMWVVA